MKGKLSRSSGVMKSKGQGHARGEARKKQRWGGGDPVFCLAPAVARTTRARGKSRGEQRQTPVMINDTMVLDKDEGRRHRIIFISVYASDRQLSHPPLHIRTHAPLHPARCRCHHTAVVVGGGPGPISGLESTPWLIKWLRTILSLCAGYNHCHQYMRCGASTPRPPAPPVVSLDRGSGTEAKMRG